MLLVFGLFVLFNTIGDQLDERLMLFWQPAKLLSTYFMLLLVILVANKMTMMIAQRNLKSLEDAADEDADLRLTITSSDIYGAPSTQIIVRSY